MLSKKRRERSQVVTAMSEAERDCEDESSGAEGLTVYVVATTYADDPHAHVEGVYANEEAANEHKKELRDEALGPVAWDVFKKEIEGKGPNTETCGFCGNEFKQTPSERQRACPQCNSTKRADA